MARISKAQKVLDRAHQHRETIERLLATTPQWQLREWFLDWADGQLRRDRFYVYSDKEHAVLAKELSVYMKQFTDFGDYTIRELIKAALTCRLDCDLEDSELLGILERVRPSQLPLWLVLRLVGICRHIAALPVPYLDLETINSEADEPLASYA